MAVQSGQYLRPARLNMVHAQLRQTAAQTLANNSWTTLNFQAEDHDTHNGHSTSVNTSRWVCPTGLGGVYELAGGVAFAGGTVGQRWCRWAKNGVEIAGSGNNMQATSGGQALLDARMTSVTLAPGDYVELQALQSQGTTLDTYIGVTYAQSTLRVKRLEAL